MCGIVGAIAKREVTGILLEGLRRLEYRGYDSAGLAVISNDGKLQINKAAGKVAALEAIEKQSPSSGFVGMAHTRWATHGKPSVENSHPHSSSDIVLVHNGIIENYEELKKQLIPDYTFVSETDTEVVAHLVHQQYKKTNDLFLAVKQTTQLLDGAYALVVMHRDHPDTLVVAREGSPLVIGVGIGEMFIASDVLALRQVTDQFIYLEEGDLAEVTTDTITIEDGSENKAKRDVVKVNDVLQNASKGEFRHFMLKEIYEQPAVVLQTLQGRTHNGRVLEQAFGINAKAIFSRIQSVQIVACGTSYHSGLVAKYWLESLAGIHCQVEVASEFRYRKVIVPEKTLFVTISQSGETADTLAALREAKKMGYESTLAIVNAPNSSLVRESDLILMTNAGPEIGVASTKAFTTQLAALFLLTIAIGKNRSLSKEAEKELVAELEQAPKQLSEALLLDPLIKKLSEKFAEKHHALFLGRGLEYPVAMEGALKLKEISYIHAEAYPAGELKHGPLALVDNEMPVVAVAPNDLLLEKLRSNLEEVRARGGELIVFADEKIDFSEKEGVTVLRLKSTSQNIAPIIFTLPLQLLSYHVAVLKGTDVDQPRNLAKSVTVE